MSRADWNEEQIKEMLRQMPKIYDNRNPKEFYQLLSVKRRKKKRVNWIVPGFASLAAIIMFIILVPSFLNMNDSVKNDSNKELNVAEENKKDQSQLKMVQDQTDQTEKFDVMKKIEVEKTAVYKEDLDNKDVLTFGIPDKNALNVIPISVLVYKDHSKDWFNQYLETEQKLTEENWGLSEYYPLNGKMTYDTANKQVNLDLPANHQYGWGSSSETAFVATLTTSFRNRSEVNKITFSTENKPGISLGNNELQHLDLVDQRKNQKPYLLLYLENSTQPLFVQTIESVNTIEDALSVMKKESVNQGLSASIPNWLEIEKIASGNSKLTIYLSNSSEIPQTPEVNYAIEAILLASKEFGFTEVEFKHNKTEKIGDFLFNQSIDVPVAANKREILP